MGSLRLKRVFDVIVAGVALIVLGPVLLAIAAAIRLVDGAPIFFTQRRSGLHGEPFPLRKFRTMSTESEDPTTDAVRITKLGRLLRATSLDELPTLLSVVRGEMSLVGPRPLPERYLERYDHLQRRRLDTPPGVTGLAQVRGRNLLSWEERFRLDVEYVETRSVLGDLKLLIETVRSVARREGIDTDAGLTMPEFMGTAAVEDPPNEEADR